MKSIRKKIYRWWNWKQKYKTKNYLRP
jgi:hypothetical protein